MSLVGIPKEAKELATGFETKMDRLIALLEIMVEIESQRLWAEHPELATPELDRAIMEQCRVRNTARSKGRGSTRR